MLRRILSTLVATACLALGLTAVAVTPAGAGPNDNFTLAKTDDVGGEALIGEEITYTLTATGSQVSGAYLYNLSFRDVLPVGVTFVSSDPAPTAVLTDIPAAGQTTLIWENVNDLPAGSSATIDYTIDTNPDFAGGTTGATTVPVGATVTNNAQAVASLDAFLIPDWSPTTGAFTGDFDGTASTSRALSIIPFRVDKVGPGELLRGVHTNGFATSGGTSGDTWTIEIQNNPDYTMTGVTLQDVLGPQLEFLGCASYYPAGDDHSTDVPFRESTAAADEEWAGSGPMATDPVSATCLTPTSVSTVAAGGGLANTVVDWTIGTLSPGQTVVVTYRAGIPMRANTITWTSAAPSAASLQQGRNLDNNAGPSTNELDAAVAPDPELLADGAPAATNTATAVGTYTPTGTSRNDSDVEITEAEDIIIGKTMSGSLSHGTTVATSLVVATSEYRDFTDLVVRDLLPSALCYTGTFGTNETPGSGWNTTDCPGAGSGTGTATSVRELPTGGPYGTGRLEVVWDETSVPGLAALPADSSITIPYSAVVRTKYRGGLAQLSSEPVLAGDEVTNHAEVSGPDFVAAGHANDGGADDEPDSTIDGDTSSASLSNTLPTIDKRVGAKAGPLVDGASVTGATCASQYGSITWQDTVATGFGPGDIVCFELGATFASQIDYENVFIEDLLPPGYTYVPGSAARVTSIDDLAATSFNAANMRWTLGTVDNSGRDFRWVIAVTISDPADGEAGDINANLQKMIHNQSGGLVFQYRDEVPAEWTEPQLDVVKGVKSVDATDNTLDVGPFGPDHDGSATGGSTSVEVQADAEVTYRVDVSNDGNTAALDVEVWDRLPTGITCAMVSSISASGACSSDRVVWTVPSIAPAASTELTYIVTMPTNVPSHETWTNTAGVRTYQAATNTGLFDYYPASNIDTTASGLENTDRADDQAFTHTAAPSVGKAQASGINESGNSSNGTPGTALDRATIGEVVRYDLTLTVPDGTRMVNGVLTDTLTTGLTYFEGSASIAGATVVVAPVVTSTAVDPEGDRLDGGALSTPAVGAGGAITYTLPVDYRNAPNGVDDTVTVTFYVQVATGSAGTTRNNSATLTYQDDAGAAQPSRTTNTTQIRIVEPSPDIIKVHTVPSSVNASPGDTVTYQITAANLSGTNISVLHDVVLVDTIPVGLTPVRSGGGLVSADGDLVASTGVSSAGSFVGTWSETNRTITWTGAAWAPLQSINPGATSTFTYQSVVDDPATASGRLTNTVALEGSNLDSGDPNLADGRTYTDSDGDYVDLPAVTFVKDIEPLPSNASDRTEVTVGEPLDYDVEVTIPADTLAYDVTVFDDLPAGADHDAFTAADISGPCVALPSSSPLVAGDVEAYGPPVGGSGSRVAWFLGDVLADGAACVITLTYTVHVDDTAVAPNDLVNSVNVRWNGTDEIASASPTALPTSHDAPADTTWDNRPAADTETIRVVEPQLAIDKDVTFPDGSAVGTCNRTPGNNATGSDDLDTQSGTTNGCDIDAGDELRYTIRLTNTGTTDAYDTVVTDVLPIGYEPLVAPGGAAAGNGATITGSTGSTGTWNAATRTVTWTLPMAIVDSGGALTVDLDVRLDPSADLTDAQDLTNTADVEEYFALTAATRATITTGDVPTYGNGAGATRGALLDDDVTVEVHFPELSIDKTAVDDATDARFDTPFTWQIVVENVAPIASAYEIDIEDALPAGWAYVPTTARITTPSGGPTAVEPTISGQDLTWAGVRTGSTQPLAPGQQIIVTFDAVPLSSVLAPDAATGIANTGPMNLHTNSATTTGEDASGASGCCDTGAGAVPYSDTDTADAVIRRADLSVTKAVLDPAPIRYGDLVTYAITVNNAGPSAATGVTLIDLLPADLTYVSTASIGAGMFSGGSGTWNVGTVPSGTTYELRVVVEVDAVGSITNIAAVETSDQWDPDSTPGNGVPTEDDEDAVTIDALDAGLGNRVWLDLDADGEQDGGEPGIPGVTVAVSWTDASSIAQVRTVVTDADGNWNMLGLPVDTQLTVTVDPSSSTAPVGTGGAGGTLPGGLRPTWELADNPDISAAQAGNGHTAGLDHATAGVVLTTGQTSYVDVDFGYVGINSLGDQVWFDIDGDGASSPETGDRPLSDVDLDIVWFGYDDVEGTADDLSYDDVTDSSGNWSIPALPDGRYRVTVDAGTLPTGAVPSYDLDGVTSANDSGIISLGVGASAPVDRVDADFAYTGPGFVGDTVWLDIDRDGIVDPVEVPLAGIRVTATYTLPTGAVTLETTTATDGTYRFDHLPLGIAITVAVDQSTLPVGVVPTHDLDGGADHTANATLTSPMPSRLDVDFGYAGQGRLGDQVWFDVDGDGTATPGSGEPGLAGVTLTLTWTNPTGGADLVLVAATDADGRYLFDHLPAGDFEIVLSDLPAGLAASYDVDGGADSSSAVTLGAAGENLDQDFSFLGTGALGDLVWHDRDADGVVDAGEPPLPGVSVVVTWTDPDSGSAHSWTVTTDADGLWRIDRVPAGDIHAAVVTATLPAGFAPTFDLDGGLDHVAELGLGAGETRLDVDFGYRQEVDLAIDKYHEGDFAIGRENQWTIDITNNGPGAAVSPVTVADDLPAGIEFVRSEGPFDCTDTDGRVRCVLVDDAGDPAEFASGDEARLILVVDVDADAAPGVVNTATVSTPTPDIEPDNDTDDDPTNVPLAVLSISKALDGALRAGGEVDYVLTVVNDGPSPTSGTIEVTDELPDGLEFVDAEAPTGMQCRGDDDEVVRCTTDEVLAVDGDLTITVTVRVTGDVGDRVVNVAEVAGGNEVNGSPLDPEVFGAAGGQASDTETALVQSPALALTGGQIAGLLGLAMLLLGLGTTTLFVRRRLA